MRGYEALCDQQQVRLRKRPEFSELEGVGVAEGLADPSIVLRSRAHAHENENVSTFLLFVLS